MFISSSIWYFNFRQEGWRLEHENPKNMDTPIVFKGIVFNEMKGVFVSVNICVFVCIYCAVLFKHITSYTTPQVIAKNKL